MDHRPTWKYGVKFTETFINTIFNIYVGRNTILHSEKRTEKWISKFLSIFECKISNETGKRHHIILKWFKTEYSFPLSLLNGMLERWQLSCASDLAFESQTSSFEFFVVCLSLTPIFNATLQNKMQKVDVHCNVTMSSVSDSITWR